MPGCVKGFFFPILASEDRFIIGSVIAVKLQKSGDVTTQLCFSRALYTQWETPKDPDKMGTQGDLVESETSKRLRGEGHTRRLGGGGDPRRLGGEEDPKETGLEERETRGDLEEGETNGDLEEREIPKRLRGEGDTRRPRGEGDQTEET